MYAFHCSIHARPVEVHRGPQITLAGGVYHTLSVPHEALEKSSFSLSFEDAQADLSQLERMYTEPDGSFVWVSPNEQAPWQVDGNLFDRSGRLLLVDVKGSCPAEQFDQLLGALGWPQTQVMFQLVREAVFLDEAEFRRVAKMHARAEPK